MAKTSSVLEFIMIYGWAILLLLIVIGALAYFGVLRPDHYPSMYCPNNPDKCVCEKCETPFTGDGIYVIKEEYPKCNGYNTKCTQFRKKTQAEIDIDDCNNNPNDNQKCTCESYKEEFRFVYNQIILKEKNIKQEDFDNITYIYLGMRVDCSRNWTEDCFVYETSNVDCEAARPKTECEKGNTNYIQQTINCSGNTFCDGDLSSIDGKTICRKRTYDDYLKEDTNKIKNFSCERIELSIGSCVSGKYCSYGMLGGKYYYRELKIAYKEKGCTG